jgi:hypothetical protein
VGVAAQGDVRILLVSGEHPRRVVERRRAPDRPADCAARRRDRSPTSGWLRRELVRDELALRDDGTLALPLRPGFGIELDRERLEEFERAASSLGA